MDTIKNKLSPLDALVICKYISTYALFEKTVKGLFSESILLAKNIAKNKLYFYYGGIVSTKVFIDYDGCQIKMDSKVFKEEELFKELSLNQIIRIDKKEHIIDYFNFFIPSIVTRLLEHPFHDCCLKLIAMRNKLAHELESLNFKDSDFIEVIPSSYIKNNRPNWTLDYDLETMLDTTKYIYCNLIFMEIMLKTLEERRKNNGNKGMDS